MIQQSLFPVQTQNLKITKSNKLVNSSYSLSQVEQRLFQLAVAKIDSRKSKNKVVVYSSEYAEAYSIKNPYRDMKKGADDFFERELKIPIEGNNKRYVRTRFVQTCEYDQGNGSITIIFGDILTPHLYEIKSKFTSYYLSHIKDFKNGYSVRIYEQIRQERDQKRQSGKKSSHTYTVDSIRELLELKDKYPIFSDLRKRVIEDTRRDITKHSDYRVNVEYIKEGRRVIKIKYVVFPK